MQIIEVIIRQDSQLICLIKLMKLCFCTYILDKPLIKFLHLNIFERNPNHFHFSDPAIQLRHLNPVDQRDITFKLCFVIVANANLVEPSRMLPPINYQTIVRKYLFPPFPLQWYALLVESRKLYFLHFGRARNTI